MLMSFNPLYIYWPLHFLFTIEVDDDDRHFNIYEI